MTPRATPDPAGLRADKAAALRLVSVSRETEKRLDRFVELLLTWQARINLVAPSTLCRVWTRHIADSLQLLAHAPQARIWVDLGSGAGFPGLVLACVLAPGDRGMVHLVESDSRKAAFLREAARITGASAEIHMLRIEDFTERWGGTADLVTARALAPLAKLMDFAAPLLEKGAQALLPKGQDVEAELTEAAKCWHIEAELLPSVTDPRGRIVYVKSIKSRRNKA
jgi:16S rRNA (guanine527-N7)-methyltransferase